MSTAMDRRTANLVLRRPRLTDAPALFEFFGDREAMRYTYASPTTRHVRRRLAAHEWQRRTDGFGPWTVEQADSGRIVGWGGLYVDPFDPGWGPEVAYFLHPDVWGRGYAGELVAASTDDADARLSLPELFSFAMPENGASCRVLERAGFHVVRYLPDMQRYLFHRPRFG
jgi:ribosomal-protein-alanine N-acetyltransferase